MNNLFIIKNLKTLKKKIPILKIQIYFKDITLVIRKQDLISVLIFLKNNISFQFKILTCISGVDYPSNSNRFTLIYELLSIRYNNRIRVKISTDELTPVESIEQVYLAANWYESEIWDMLGVFFNNHSNLVRLLTDYGFEGYPLRKDFPLSGFVEVSYDYTRKRISNERIELSQEFRPFKFTSPWEIRRI